MPDTINVNARPCPAYLEMDAAHEAAHQQNQHTGCMFTDEYSSYYDRQCLLCDQRDTMADHEDQCPACKEWGAYNSHTVEQYSTRNHPVRLAHIRLNQNHPIRWTSGEVETLPAGTQMAVARCDDLDWAAGWELLCPGFVDNGTDFLWMLRLEGSLGQTWTYIPNSAVTLIGPWR